MVVHPHSGSSGRQRTHLPILRQTAPEAKILILLRAPVDRYRSDISRKMPRCRLRNVRYRGLARGFYSAELEPWEQEYDPSQMLVLQYEVCRQQSAELLAATYRFVSLNDSFLPEGLKAAINKTATKRKVGEPFERLLVELKPDVVAVAARHPQVDLRLGPNLSRLAS